MPHRGIELKITCSGMWALRNAKIIFNKPKDLTELERESPSEK
jgi:hypothetical protein